MKFSAKCDEGEAGSDQSLIAVARRCCVVVQIL